MHIIRELCGAATVFTLASVSAGSHRLCGGTSLTAVAFIGWLSIKMGSLKTCNTYAGGIYPQILDGFLF